jgi:acyl-coenzyme A thioesterase PaaI-like protein
MTEPATHLQIDRQLCGEPVLLEPGKAVLRLTSTKGMAVDDKGLVHGGFIFGVVDHAAMLAVNEPNVVLASAEVKFLAPVRAGDEVMATARRLEHEGKKHKLEVHATVGEHRVFEGTMTAVVPEQNVLDKE